MLDSPLVREFVATGKAAANAAMPWMAPGGRPLLDSAAFLSFVHAVLYRVEWGSGFTVHLSVVCTSAQAATNLYQLLKFFQAANLAGNAPGAAAFVRDMEVQVEVTADVFGDTIGAMEAVRKKLSDEIAHILGIRVKLTLVQPHTIERSQGKAKRVIDRRKM